MNDDKTCPICLRNATMHPLCTNVRFNVDALELKEWGYGLSWADLGVSRVYELDMDGNLIIYEDEQ